MATVRPGVMCACRIQGHRGSVTNCEVSLDEEEIGVKTLEVIREGRKRVNLSVAKVIVAAGRGVGDMKGFKLIEELAGVLGAEVAGTRVTVENGWLEADRQVGQTGQSVHPELYIACGISGAIQHRAGMLDSRYVVAINTDPRAPIFEIADWGIVGDLHKVIPELIGELKLICAI
jgi:electron transfer flavoprotein alpha subunit